MFFAFFFSVLNSEGYRWSGLTCAVSSAAVQLIPVVTDTPEHGRQVLTGAEHTDVLEGALVDVWGRGRERKHMQEFTEQVSATEGQHLLACSPHVAQLSIEAITFKIYTIGGLKSLQLLRCLGAQAAGVIAARSALFRKSKLEKGLQETHPGRPCCPRSG